MLEIVKTKGDITERLLKIRDQIELRSHRNRASLLLADVYFKNNNINGAQETYKEILNNSQGINHDMASIGLAYTYEAKKEFKKAISLYKLVIDANTTFPLFQVYWSMVRCHVNNKENSNALLVLREMQIKFSGPDELEKIDKRIKQLST